MIHDQYSFLYYHSVPVVSCYDKALHDYPSNTTISTTLYPGILSLTYSVPATLTSLLFPEHSQHASNMEPLRILLLPLPNTLFPQITRGLTP